eukprot:scaffold6647_cov13-Tisochrysis_lutea.AAC.1
MGLGKRKRGLHFLLNSNINLNSASTLYLYCMKAGPKKLEYFTLWTFIRHKHAGETSLFGGNVIPDLTDAYC